MSSNRTAMLETIFSWEPGEDGVVDHVDDPADESVAIRQTL